MEIADHQSEVRCASCEHSVPETPGLPPEERMPCANCGSTARIFSKSLFETVSVRSFLDGKKKAPGFPSKKKVRIHFQLGDQINHKTGEWVFKQRRVDKDASPAWYFERVTDSETGDVIHDCSEPLEKHTERGSAKPPAE